MLVPNSLCFLCQMDAGSQRLEVAPLQTLCIQAVLIEVCKLWPGTQRRGGKEDQPPSPAVSWQATLLSELIFPRHLVLFLYFLAHVVWKLSWKAQAKLSECLLPQEIHQKLPGSDISTLSFQYSNTRLVTSIIYALKINRCVVCGSASQFSSTAEWRLLSLAPMNAKEHADWWSVKVRISPPSFHVY